LSGISALYLPLLVLDISREYDIIIGNKKFSKKQNKTAKKLKKQQIRKTDINITLKFKTLKARKGRSNLVSVKREESSPAEKLSSILSR